MSDPTHPVRLGEFGSTLLISEPVRYHAGIEAEPMAPMMLRGRRESVELFRVA